MTSNTPVTQAVPTDAEREIAKRFGDAWNVSAAMKFGIANLLAQHRHRQSSSIAGGVDVVGALESALDAIGINTLPIVRRAARIKIKHVLASLSTPTAEPMAELQRLGQEYDGASALSGDAGEGELRAALAKRTSMSTIAGGGKRPHVEIRFADVTDAHALTDAILNRSNKEGDHGPRS